MNKQGPMNDAACDSRQEKHHELDEAILNLRGLVQHTSTLLNRISNKASDNTAKVTSGPVPPEISRQRPCLREVLEGGASEINVQTEEIHNLLDSITDALF